MSIKAVKIVELTLRFDRAAVDGADQSNREPQPPRQPAHDAVAVRSGAYDSRPLWDLVGR
jgi:hypothetical protein